MKKTKIKYKGKLKSYMQWPVVFLVILAIMNVAVYTVSVKAGLVVSGFLALFGVLTLLLIFRHRPLILNDLISFATQYGQVQKTLLDEFSIPYALLDSDGRLIWMNEEFSLTVGKDKDYRKNIQTLFPEIHSGTMPGLKGVKEIEIHYLNEEGTRLKASMGKASFWSDEVPVEGPRREIINETMVFGHIPYPVTCLSIGNPHLVILMDEISKDLVCRIGKYSETAKQFPEKINTQIIKVLDRTHLQTEVYERGAGYTLASGSGCCAAAAAAYRLGLTDPKMIVQMPEGTMEVEIREDGEIFLTGDVGYIGSISLGSFFTEQLKTM